MDITDIGEAPFLEVLSFLEIPEVSRVAAVCRTFRKTSALTWKNIERSQWGRQGQDATVRDRCCRFYKGQQYASRMEALALQHYDYADPEPTHVKCWCCRDLPNLCVRAFRYPQKYEFFCRIANRINENDPKEVLWEGFLEAAKMSYSGLSLNVQGILEQVQLHEAFQTYIFQSAQQNYVTMCDATDSLMITVVAVERVYPWKTTLVLATGGFHDCLPTPNDRRCFRFHPRMVRSHGIMRDEDYITAGFVTRSERLGEPMEDCRLVLEHQW